MERRPLRVVPPPPLGSDRRWWRSFHHAFSGIVAAARTQTNFRLQLVAAAGVLLAALAWHLPRIDVVALALAVALVLALELANTALEALVDLVSPAEHPLAKLAKDAAAGAVLAAAAGAAVVGWLCFGPTLGSAAARLYRSAVVRPGDAAVAALIVVGLATVAAKAKAAERAGAGISGHAALAFAAATLCALLAHDPLPAGLAYFLALLVTQSRVAAGATPRAVFWGALLGTAVCAAAWFCLRFPRVV